MRDRLFFALDVNGYAPALKLAHALRNSVGGFKMGLELFVSRGPRGVQEISTYGDVLLDLKLHDIPVTVARTTRIVRELDATYLTVHVGDDGASVRAAVDAAGDKLKILAVTVLTSVEDASGVERRVKLAADAGAWGVVCYGLEAPWVRETHPQLRIVTPGIRLKEGPADDQKRVVTPESAIRSGADIIVVGRAIRDAEFPRMAAHICLQQMEHVYAGM